MQYQFDHEINRLQTASIKWDLRDQRFTGDALPMWVADMDFQSPAPVIEALKRRADHGVFGYTMRETYYDALVHWMQRRHEWAVKNEWLVNSPGIVPALGFIINTFTEPGDSIVIQQPVYYPFMNLIERNGRKFLNNPLQFDGLRYSMDFDDLERKLASKPRLLILCNPHNPVGRVWSREELSRLGELCLAHNVLVASDEIHCDLVLPGHTHTPFASVHEEFARHSLTCVSPSKTFNLAGLHTAAVIIPDDAMRESYQSTLKRFSLGSGNVFGVVAADTAYQHGDEWLDQLLEYLNGNVDYLTDYVQVNIPELKVIPPEGTYLVWIDCRQLGLDDKELDDFFLRKAKIALDTGNMFGPGGEGFVRLNIACPRSIVERALKQIHDAVRHLAASESLS